MEQTLGIHAKNGNPRNRNDRKFAKREEILGGVLGQDLARAWPGPGQDLARTWPGPGQDLVRTWSGPGQDLVRIQKGVGDPSENGKLKKVAR